MDKIILIKKELKECKLSLNELYPKLKIITKKEKIRQIKYDITATEYTRDKLNDLKTHFTNGIGEVKLQELTNQIDNELELYKTAQLNTKKEIEAYWNAKTLKNSLNIINENYLSKEEIYEYLNNYNEMMRLTKDNMDTPIFDLFKIHMIRTNQEEKINTEYYLNMIKIHLLFVNVSILSSTKDEDFKYLKGNDEEMGEKTKKGTLTFLKDKFIIPTDASYFKKTHIFNFIRNAFCHSNNNELYKITKDCNFVTINLKKTKPYAFRVKLSAPDIYRMTRYIREYSHQASAFELENQDKITTEELYDHYHKCSRQLDKTCFVRKMLPKTIQERKGEIHEELSKKENAFSKEGFDKTLNSYGTVTDKRYYFSEEQKRLLHKKFQFFEEKLSPLEMKYFVLPIIVNYMPFGLNKMNFLYCDIAVAHTYLFAGDKSMRGIMIDILKDYNELGNGRKLKEDKPTIFNYIEKDVDVASRYGWLYVFDDEERENINDILLLKYVFGTVNEEQKVNIGGVEYDAEHIRNALTHNRYRGYRNLRQQRCFYLYDDEDTIADPDNAFWSSNFLYDDLRKASEDIMTNYINNKNNSNNKTKVLTK